MTYLPERIDRFDGDYAFLSNFYPAPLVFEDIPYLNAEAAYQSAKTLNMNVRRQFMNLSGGQAKRMGKKIDLREDWLLVREDVMYRVVYAKFYYNPDLRKLLLDTGDVELVEGNYWGDRFWGVCGGTGENKLGKILMRVRSEFRAIVDVYSVTSNRSGDSRISKIRR